MDKSLKNVFEELLSTKISYKILQVLMAVWMLYLYKPRSTDLANKTTNYRWWRGQSLQDLLHLALALVQSGDAAAFGGWLDWRLDRGRSPAARLFGQACSVVEVVLAGLLAQRHRQPHGPDGVSGPAQRKVVVQEFERVPIPNLSAGPLGSPRA